MIIYVWPRWCHFGWQTCCDDTRVQQMVPSKEDKAGDMTKHTNIYNIYIYLRFVALRRHRPWPQERDRKKSERRSADVRVWRCRSAGVRVWRCRSAGVRVWRCRSASVRVWRCKSADEDVKMSKKTAHRSPAYFTLSLSHHLWRVILAQGPLMQQSVTLIRTDTRLYLAETEFMC